MKDMTKIPKSYSSGTNLSTTFFYCNDIEQFITIINSQNDTFQGSNYNNLINIIPNIKNQFYKIKIQN